MSKSRFTVRQLTTAAIIAGIYAALTLLLPIPQYGGVQLRVAEAMTVLPFFFPEAIPGLAVGCFLANLLGSPYVLDWIFGTLATLLAALWTSRIKHRALAPPSPGGVQRRDRRGGDRLLRHAGRCRLLARLRVQRLHRGPWRGHCLLRAGHTAAARSGACSRPQACLMRFTGSVQARSPFFMPGNFFLLPPSPLPSP